MLHPFYPVNSTNHSFSINYHCLTSHLKGNHIYANYEELGGYPEMKPLLDGFHSKSSKILLFSLQSFIMCLTLS